VVDHLGGTPQGGRFLAWPIELGGLSSGWGEAALRLWVWVWLGDEWPSSELGRGIRRGGPPVEDAFVPSGWAG
jgi:hypothetical protein